MKQLFSLALWLRKFTGMPSSPHAEVGMAIEGAQKQLDRLAVCRSLESAVFRKRVTLRLRNVAERLDQLAQGRLVFESTETWRTVYEDVLNACKVRRYLSVALIRSDDYWRDAPGENSLEFNYLLVDHGFHVHRVFVIDEFFWPRTARTPSTELFHWIQDQRQRGVEVSLVRLTEIENEPELIGDIGIYGDQAVGSQQTDLEGRTVRYEISFVPDDVTAAEERWNQLLLFAKPLDEIVLVN